ncbi:hypothetical protein WR25_15789 isoform B [Diploscapter pachys]|uniref:Metalloendopeptidase n=1 Tax=Diploscapter pachys TaxID=2018661 RepID=A0A2A2LXD0_9BILA|nr:hypothetical protein WR25_15789 isoform A [Diploscapter pachys]PAV90882.1 hypothetical protein WR25_15789 isoform B [Diploscapter pachys]
MIRQASTVYNKWTNNEIFYYFDKNFPLKKRDLVEKALSILEEVTCARFKQNSTSKNRIRVFQGNGEQELSLGQGCHSIGTIQHEFLHAIGIWHEHMRSDRDDYLTVDLSDVSPSKQYNFDKLNERVSQNFIDFDYASVMHYPPAVFTTNNTVSMYTISREFQFTIGMKQLAFSDIYKINQFLNCTGIEFYLIDCPIVSVARIKVFPNL